MSFKEWLTILEGGKGSGNKKMRKMSSTGFNAGGQAQSGAGMFKPAKPHMKINMKVNNGIK
jgi:hypothetical protein